MANAYSYNMYTVIGGSKRLNHLKLLSEIKVG